MVPQLCRECGPGTPPRVIVNTCDGWGVDGDLTYYELECGHAFLLHTQ